MRKVLLFFLVIVMVFSFNIIAVKADSTADIFTLEYEKIEDMIFEYNLTIQTNILSLRNIIKAIENLDSAKANAEKETQKQIDIINMQIEYYQQQLDLLKPVSMPVKPGQPVDEDAELGNGAGNDLGADSESFDKTDSNKEVINDPDLYDAVNKSIAYIRAVYQDNIDSLELSKLALLSSKGLPSDIETQKLSLNSSILQLAKSNYQIVKEAQALFLLYHSLDIDYEELTLQLGIKETERKITKLKRNLGMATGKQLEAIEQGIKNLDAAIDKLMDQRNDILSQLNFLLGREHNRPLRLGNLPTLNNVDMVLDYKLNLQTMKEKSYSWMTELNNYQIKSIALDNTKNYYGLSSEQYKEANLNFKTALISLVYKERELEKNFDYLYNDLIDKKEELDLKEEELLEAQQDYELAILKYNLAISNELEKESAKVLYENQELAVRRASYNLIKANMEYQWSQKGLL